MCSRDETEGLRLVVQRESEGSAIGVPIIITDLRVCQEATGTAVSDSEELLVKKRIAEILRWESLAWPRTPLVHDDGPGSTRWRMRCGAWLCWTGRRATLHGLVAHFSS